jgi:hypothetical protein
VVRVTVVSGLDRQDQVRVEEEVLVGMAETMETDHVPVFGTNRQALNASARGCAGAVAEGSGFAFRPPVVASTAAGVSPDGGVGDDLRATLLSASG